MAHCSNPLQRKEADHMSRFLMIDIGAGTMDILHYDDVTGENFKAVAPSPVRQVAWAIAHTRGPLAVSGVEMGGGPVTDALLARVKQSSVAISHSAAATLNHDLEKVRAWGFKLVPDESFDAFAADFSHTPIRLADIQPERIIQLLDSLGLPIACDVVAVCGQDHGVPPAGVSHLDFRHTLYQSFLAEHPSPAGLLFRNDQVPAAFNRLRSMALSATQLGSEVYVMDSGMAAILGASQDAQAAGLDPVAVLDIATSHTVAAVVSHDTLEGFFEYHTRDITPARLETLLRDLADGRIEHTAILAEGGHGAYLRRAVDFDALKAIIATGPKRKLLADCRLPITWGAPWGDNMMTGTVGLLEAVRRRRQMAPIQYI
jgi:uncharacterized protein (DUF1786 family)